MPLNRTLGLPMLTFYGIGMILGAGIYSILGTAAGLAGESVWLGFVLAAIAAALTGLSYAELATMYPTAGAEYTYLRKAYSQHRWIAATVGLVVSFAGCASAATVSVAFASYLQNFVHSPVLLVAALVLTIFTVVNIIGIQESSWVNVIFTLIEVSGLVLFSWLGMQNPDFGKALLAEPTMMTFSSAALIIFAFLGFENIVSLAEETKDPDKNIPRAILLSILISTVLYVFVSLAAVALLSPEELAASTSALTDAARKGSPRWAGILGGIALFSTANTALIAMVSSSRILYGIAKDHSLPKIIGETLRKRKTPWVAALVVFAFSLALLPLGKIEILASVSSFTTMLAFIVVNVAVIKLRLDQPETRRPFRVPLQIGRWPILPLIATATCLAFITQFESQAYVVGLAACAASAGVYLLFRKLGWVAS